MVGAYDVGMAKKQRTVIDQEAHARESVQASKDAILKAEEDRRQLEKEFVRELEGGRVAKPSPAICKLCKRKFSSREALQLHEDKSELHQQNLEKAAEQAARELGC